MQVVVVADTHMKQPGNPGLPLESADVVVHAGDFVSRAVFEYFDGYTLHAVHGNADEDELQQLLPERCVFALKGVRFVVLHGHTLGSRQELSYVGAEHGADVVVYGHTHKPMYRDRGVGLLNPGSPTEPRGNPPTYAELYIEDGEYEGRILSIDGDLLFDID